LHHRRQSKAFGGHTSVAQPLAGAHMPVVAEAGIEQRFTGGLVLSPLRTDREWSGFRGEGDRGLESGHGTSVLAPAAMHAVERRQDCCLGKEAE
jgi:hypothetical protein